MYSPHPILVLGFKVKVRVAVKSCSPWTKRQKLSCTDCNTVRDRC